MSAGSERILAHPHQPLGVGPAAAEEQRQLTELGLVPVSHLDESTVLLVVENLHALHISVNTFGGATERESKSGVNVMCKLATDYLFDILMKHSDTNMITHSNSSVSQMNKERSRF